MTRIGVMKLTKAQRNVRDTIRRFGGDPSLMHSPMARKAFIKRLNDKQRETITSILVKSFEAIYGQADRNRRGGRRIMCKATHGGLTALLGELTPTERVYLYWESP